MNVDNRLDWLRWYASQGMRLIPCFEVRKDGLCACGTAPECKPRNYGKHPRLSDWRNVATSDPMQLEAWHHQWPTANWAWVLGADDLVIDSDPRNGGLKPDEFFDVWQETCGFALPETPIQETGGGGVHVVLKMPPGQESRSGKLYVNGRSLPGIERKGHGGYVLVYPSNHRLGAYRWENPGVPPALAPSELLPLMSRKGGGPGESAPGADDPPIWDDRGERFNPDRWLVEADAVSCGEQRHHLLRGLGSMRHRNLSRAETITLAWTVAERFTTCDPADPWTLDYVVRLVDQTRESWEVGPGASLTPEELAAARELAKRAGETAGDASVGTSALAMTRMIETRIVPAGDFALDEPEKIPAIWGTDERILWAEGEGLMIAGHQGVGKTTIGHQIMLFRIGIREGEFLGLRVAPTTGKVIVFAMDRPRQAARSLRRMVTAEQRQVLNKRVVVWRGPLPFNPIEKPSLLADFIQGVCLECTDAVVDSVKDLAPGLAKDEVGAALNLAWQEVIARGIELLLLHHERKAGQDSKRHHALDDVYGSTFLTSGLGSVIAIDGDPGDPTVELRHLKQPAEPVGPLTVRHDHAAGQSSLLTESVDLLDLLVQAGDRGITAAYAAERVLGRTTDADQLKIRRQLGKLVTDDLAFKRKGARSHAGAMPDLWFATDGTRWAYEQGTKL